MQMVLVYITCANQDEARRIGQELVRQHLAACTNVFPAVESFFYWEERLEQAKEAVVVAKTTEEKASMVVEAVCKWHSYTVPAVIVLPVEGGNPAFIKWVLSEVGSCRQ